MGFNSGFKGLKVRKVRGKTITRPRNVVKQIPSDAVSYPKSTEPLMTKNSLLCHSPFVTTVFSHLNVTRLIS